MPDISFTIPLPILTGAQYFKYRYKAVGGAYGGYSTTTSQTITLTGLSPDDYEIEIIFVNEEGIECTATVLPFTVIEPFACIEDFAGVITENNGIYTLTLTYTPGDNPACGWDIQLSNLGGTSTVHYTTLPITGVIHFTLTGNYNTGVTIFGDVCGSEREICFEEVIDKVNVPCTPLVLTSYDLIPDPNFPGQYYIRLFGTNSTPGTPTYIFNYSETSPGSFPNSGTFTFPGGLAGGAFLYSIHVVQQNFNADVPNCLRWEGSITDVCGTPHLFCVTLPVGCVNC